MLRQLAYGSGEDRSWQRPVEWRERVPLSSKTVSNDKMCTCCTSEHPRVGDFSLFVCFIFIVCNSLWLSSIAQHSPCQSLHSFPLLRSRVLSFALYSYFCSLYALHIFEYLHQALLNVFANIYFDSSWPHFFLYFSFFKLFLLSFQASYLPTCCALKDLCYLATWKITTKIFNKIVNVSKYLLERM